VVDNTLCPEATRKLAILKSDIFKVAIFFCPFLQILIERRVVGRKSIISGAVTIFFTMTVIFRNRFEALKSICFPQ